MGLNTGLTIMVAVPARKEKPGVKLGKTIRLVVRANAFKRTPDWPEDHGKLYKPTYRIKGIKIREGRVFHP